MRHALVLVLLVLGIGFASVACDSDEPVVVPTATETPEITPSPEATPATPTASPSPTSTPVADEEGRTGDATLDAVIDAVEQQDVAALLALVEPQSVECVATQEGLGGPPLCREGEPAGTVVEVFPAAYCEGVLDHFPGTVLGQFVSVARGLYAVTEGPDEERSVPYWPVGDTFIVFHTESPSGLNAGRLVLEDGRIVMAAFGCPGTPQEMASWRGQPLPPIAGPFEEPQVRERELPATGIEGVDAVIAAVAAYDLGALTEMTEAGEQACVERIGDAAEVECDTAKGETPGDPVAVFPVAYCEGALSHDLAATYRAFLSYAPELHAVVEAPAAEPDRPVWRRGDYYLVYRLHSDVGIPEAARVVVDATGNILVLWYGCAPSVEELMQHNGEPLPVILPPTDFYARVAGAPGTPDKANRPIDAP